ncbi:MAG: YqiA/YcfP family alpha/beta fold hydrolase [Sneathiella sp.]|uniref:YqiA/YcfP family alpha/beta fold hydrolase n=1 Tax=Sneathiella sp. TaxID=1964365 RepID=UPI0030033276
MRLRNTVRGWVGKLQILLLLILFVCNPFADAAAIEFGMFKENTIFSKDTDGFKDKVLLLFHGLRSAHPNSTFRRLEKALSDEYSVVGVNYDYLDVERNKRELDDLWTRYLAGHEVFVLGTSLGGFWADYFANKYGLEKMVLVNPVTSPVHDLTQFVGEQYSERRQKHFVVTPEHIEDYAALPLPTHPNTKSLVILTRDDPVINFRQALEKYLKNENSQLVIFGTGGHSLPLSDPKYLSALKAFFESK